MRAAVRPSLASNAAKTVRKKEVSKFESHTVLLYWYWYLVVRIPVQCIKYSHNKGSYLVNPVVLRIRYILEQLKPPSRRLIG
jgi:hypothetical protein